MQNFKILLLEGVSPVALDLLVKAGFQVEYHKKALPEKELLEKIQQADVIGIRSKTKLTQTILESAPKLKLIACFCIGTNQVDLDYATSKGIVVFNSPFSNSRSVAELVIGEAIALSRHLGDFNNRLHSGDTVNRINLPIGREIRGKVIGIVGYGHIGSQLSVLADAFGLTVIFHDIVNVSPLGTAKKCEGGLDELLEKSDIVTLHVPETADTKNMIGHREIQRMKPGSILINASRGTVVDLDALAQAMKSGHLSGCAVDVYPVEPFANGPGFQTVLQNCPNTLLTPHIGGSTEEAQVAIGNEVASSILRFFQTGSTIGSVNMPELDLNAFALSEDVKNGNVVRVLNFHKNVPGVLKQINKHLSEHNIIKQDCDSKETVSYFAADLFIEQDSQRPINQQIQQVMDGLFEISESLQSRIIN